MADDIRLNPGVGGDLTGAKDHGGVKFQRLINYDPELAYDQGGTYYRERLIAPSYTVLSDSIADGIAAYWVQTNANGGTFALAAGEGLLQTTTAAAGSSQAISPAPMYQPGQVNWLRCAGRFGDTGVAGNVRRIGVFTVTGLVPQDGFAFELDGATLYAASYKAGVVTRVAVGAWTNLAVSPFSLDTNYHMFELRWGGNFCHFYIDNVFRHSASGGASAITTTLNFPMALQNIKTSGATNLVLAIRNIGVGRFGEPPAVGKQTDIGRVIRNFALDAYTAAPAAEAAQQVVQWYNNAAVAATAQPVVVPPGKIFRLQGMRLSTKALATFGSAVLRVRANTTGLATAASPYTGLSLEAGGRAGATTVSATGHLDHAEITFPDGHDFLAGTGLAFTLAGYGPAGAAALQGVTRFEVWGYEYTAP